MTTGGRFRCQSERLYLLCIESLKMPCCVRHFSDLARSDNYAHLRTYGANSRWLRVLVAALLIALAFTKTTHCVVRFLQHPSCGGLGGAPAGQRPSPGALATAARAGKRSSHVASRKRPSPPASLPQRPLHVRRGPLRGMLFDLPLPARLRRSGARALPPTGSCQTTSLRYGICLSGPVGSPTSSLLDQWLTPPLSAPRRPLRFAPAIVVAARKAAPPLGAVALNFRCGTGAKKARAISPGK